ncbi:hypothetical protein L0Y65_00325 [Candidatus Micrarchaeota archaeon]|nr:hypothetical protein [Candidatus Micrarchaeota archaeon]
MRPAYAIALFLAGTALMMQFYGQETLLLVLMSISALACLAIDKWKNARMFLIAMLVGGACENIAVMLGAWSYNNAGFLFAPLWLPVGWGMSVVLLEEAFSQDAHVPGFSKRALAMSFGGTLVTAAFFPLELGVLAGFVFVTLLLFAVKYYHPSEIRAGLFAALFGTAMETACIMAGNWQYSAAMFGTPLWLPLCWFNAFLIMRRIAR